MTHKAKLAVLTLVAGLVIGACGRRPEPETPAPQPEPTPPAQPSDDAERARREAEERARREAEERARARAALEAMIHFDFDRADLRPDARQVLDAKIPILRNDPSIRLRIEGHADERGSVEYNLALGMRRANAAKQYLASFGLDESRFETVSFGEERPLDPGHNEEAWAKNRRAEFRITAGSLAGQP